MNLQITIINQGGDIRGRGGKLERETGVVVDLGQEGMVPMETNMIMEEMMDDGLDDACTIS